MLWQSSTGHRLHDFRCYPACRFVEFDTSVMTVICHVFMHCFGSFLLQAMFFKSPSICFQRTNYEINREDVVYLHYTL